ncbi:unnamed protein product [Rotaria magnacalcarata]|uniref:Peptidase C1A papain C-terminal domain-containing protein n=1 Tax=Rotaria magnacalcarata TaxID=392030 RepID=A0A816T291_9BILA|nr:unnamed protein product [Rotaria magnacalcarata]
MIILHILHNLIDPDRTNYDNVHVPESFDWREKKNVVSSIKNQLTCASCYAFATVFLLKTLYALKRKTTEIVEFSSQKITDCSSHNQDYKNGTFEGSMRFVKKNGGKLATLTSYPYNGTLGSCRTSIVEEIHLGTVQYRSLEVGNKIILAKALVLKGLIFIGLDTDSKLFTVYKEDILKITQSIDWI